MYKLNYIQYPKVQDINFSSNYSLETLKNNDLVEEEISLLKKEFRFNSLYSFRFSDDGILALMLKLKGKILVSKGESQAIIDAAIRYKNLGFDLEFISIKKDGTLDYEEIKKADYIFISPYIIDTYVNIDFNIVKEKTDALVISNISAMPSFRDCDVAILDSYKLTGYSFSSILFHNDLFEEQYLAQIDTVSIFEINKAIKRFSPNIKLKEGFKTLLINEFKEDIHFFVDSDKTLPYTLHFGLKNIKAREIIRTLALSNIFVTNGEGCSLGLSKPSRIIQEMGYEESESRWALSLSFFQDLDENEIEKIVKMISKKYRQIRMLND
ncbi:cysteine desulfurase [Campylobacterota bacterium DY0563]